MVISTGYVVGTETFSASLTCSKGNLRIDMFGGVHLNKEKKWVRLPGSAAKDAEHEALLNEWKAFVEAVDSISSPAVSGEYGRHIMEIVLAARVSSLHKKEVWI